MIPPRANAGFAAAVGDVLAVYHRPHDPSRPVVCRGGGGEPLTGDVRPPLPVRPGHAAKEDHEDKRNGAANVVMPFGPLRGWRPAEVTERRANRDPARVIRELLDVWSPAAERVVRVLDPLSTHTPAAPDDASGPAEARRRVERRERHDTPRHGSWMNMAELERSVLARPGLDRRLPDLATLRAEVAAWEVDRDREAVKVEWQFTTADARVKLKRLYPVLEPATSGVAEH